MNGDKLFWDATAATGTGWVLMVGEMIHIAVSANDQVCLSICLYHTFKQKYSRGIFSVLENKMLTAA